MLKTIRLFPKRTQLIDLFAFIKLLRVEPFLLLIELQLHMKTTPTNQLIVDKICRMWYNQTADYCYELPQRHENSGGHGHDKSAILADSVQFGAYNTYISTIPGLIWALFMGAWIDRYVKARKMLLLLSATAMIIESILNIYLSINFESNVYYMLLPHIPTMVLGSNLCYKIAIISYITTTTPPKWRSLRFLIYELCVTIASPIGSAAGGYLLEQKPYIDFGGGTIRNYTTCFFIALASQLLAISWTLFFVNEKLDINSSDDTNNNNGIELKVRKTKLDGNENERKDKPHPIKLLFDLNNVTEMIRCCVKRRKNKVRAQIWCIFLATIVYFFIQSGRANVFLQFAQKQYDWTPDYYSYMNAINSFAHSVITATIIPVIMKVWKVNDIPLSLIGFYTYCISATIRGAISKSIGYFLALPFQSFSTLCNTGLRAYVSKIISQDEVGKIFSLLSVMESVVPSIANTLYAVVFKQTIDSYAGAVFHMSAVFCFIPIFILIWIDVFNRRKLNIVSEKTKSCGGDSIVNMYNTKL